LLSAEQIRNAPAEVRRWLEQELRASLGLQAAKAQPDIPRLIACDVEEAAKVLSLIQGMIPVTGVFFELGHQGASTAAPGLEAFRLVDILRRIRLQNLQQVIACLDTISEAFRRIRGDADAVFYVLDDQGHCFIAEETQRSISRVWQEIVSTHKPEAPGPKRDTAQGAPASHGSPASAHFSPVWSVAPQAEDVRGAKGAGAGTSNG
jgi:hypothetical protein